MIHMALENSLGDRPEPCRRATSTKAGCGEETPPNPGRQAPMGISGIWKILGWVPGKRTIGFFGLPENLSWGSPSVQRTSHRSFPVPGNLPWESPGSRKTSHGNCSGVPKTFPWGFSRDFGKTLGFGKTFNKWNIVLY